MIFEKSSPSSPHDPCFCEPSHENIGGKSIIFVQFLKSKIQRNTLIYKAGTRFLWGTKKFPKNTPKNRIDSRNENTHLNNTKFVLCFKGVNHRILTAGSAATSTSQQMELICTVCNFGCGILMWSCLIF